MKGKRALWALAGALSVMAWQQQENLHLPPLRTLFNDGADRLVGAPKHYHLPSLVTPEETENLWRIRIGARPITLGGHHLFLEFLPYDDQACLDAPGARYQVHGVAMDRERRGYAELPFESLKAAWRYLEDKDVLKVVGVDHDLDNGAPGKKPTLYVDIWYGTKDEALKLYLDAMMLADAMNRDDDDYRIVSQNSNSVIRTALAGMGIDVPDLFDARAASEFGGRIWVPGFDRCLMPGGWDRQAVRRHAGYGRLHGDRLQQKAEAASRGEVGIWPGARRDKPAAPTS